MANKNEWMNERTNEWIFSERSAEESRPISHVNHLKQTWRPVSEMAIGYVSVDDSALRRHCGAAV